MPANLEWDVAMTIVSPFKLAGLDLNTVLPLAGRDYAFRFQVLPDGYKVSPGKFRAVADSVSQADGSSLQPPFFDGMVATMEIHYFVCPRGDEGSAEPACGDDLRQMNELLVGVLNSLRTWTADPNNDQRYIWTPTGLGDRRMLTNVMLASLPVEIVKNDPRTYGLTFSLGSPYAYAINATQTDTAIAAAGSDSLDNTGNADSYPVIKVHGATSAFTITNEETGAQIIYDSGRPGAVAIGGGSYAEIDTFQGSIFLNGDGADLVAGLDPTSVLFPLAPGAQTISVTGAAIDILWNSAVV